ncbi:MAG: AgmX/PglI C-terminal domain-containing protein [Polyangiales bacterium]
MVSPFGGLTESGVDAQNALGNMNGEAIGDAFGYGGLGASGTGWGGGGTGEGTIGLGSVGTMGHGAGTGSGQGYGSGAGRGLRTRAAAGPLVRAAPPEVNGLISPDAVRRVVLRNLGQVTHCHEQGLAQNANAAGRITVRFVIGGTGAVMASGVAGSTYPNQSVADCIANAVRRWQFPAPEGGGIATVNYPFNLTNESGDAPPTSPQRAAPSATPRSVASLAAIATQGGSTRYDLPNPVTVPNRSATMVMLAARDVPGERMYLFAPDPGVPESASHPFHVARFVNRSGATLERGPLAIFEDGAFLGQGMLDALPDGATATVPFSLQRAVSVERSETSAIEGARLVSMHHGELTIERYTVRRATFHVRNGATEALRVMVREALNGATLHEPPAGTENANGAALAPCQVAAGGASDVLVTSRTPFTITTDLSDENAGAAVDRYLREGAPAADVATSLRAAMELHRSFERLTAERADVERRREDLQRGAEETRSNLAALEGNARASDLRASAHARLGRTATAVRSSSSRDASSSSTFSSARCACDSPKPFAPSRST